MRRWASVLFLLAACTRPVNQAMCVTGDQKSCPCLGGGQGIQICLGDGSYGACVCSDLGVPNRDLSVTPNDAGRLADLGARDLQGRSVDLGAADLSVGDAAVGDLAASDLPAPADLSGADLAGADLTGRPDLGDGVVCSGSICTGSQICCLNGSASAGTCYPATGCDGGSPFVCDGPEDCSGGQCCVSVGDVAGFDTGSAQCQASCPPALYMSTGTNSYTERSLLCHADGDCAGYSGTVYVGGFPFTLPFDRCCHSARTTPYQVCMNSTYGPSFGYSCP